MIQFQHGGNLKRYPDILYDFSINLNPFGLPASVKQAVKNALEYADKYPDPESTGLRKQIAEKESVDMNSVICGNGAADLIYRIIRAVSPVKVVLTAPSFSEYEAALKIRSNCEIVWHILNRTNDFEMDESFLDLLTPDIDLVVLCNPNNPTGRLIDEKLMRKIVELCAGAGIRLLVDESFIDFTDQKSLAAMTADWCNLIVLKAFTKAYAMAGIRLGYCLTSDRELQSRLYTQAQPWSVSILAEAAGIAALDEKQYIQTSKEFIKTERLKMMEKFRSAGIECYNSDVNFILLKTDRPIFQHLLERKVLIRKCNTFRGLDETYYRIAVKKEEQNQILIQSLEEL